MTSEIGTSSLHELLTRFQSGEAAALDELIRRTAGRLERLAHKMLHGFPALRAREQTDDVLQNALVRLARSLREVRPPRLLTSSVLPRNRFAANSSTSPAITVGAMA